MTDTSASMPRVGRRATRTTPSLACWSALNLHRRRRQRHAGVQMVHDLERAGDKQHDDEHAERQSHHHVVGLCHEEDQ